MKRLLFTIQLLGASAIAFSQTNYYHNAFWGRVVFSDKITSKLNWDVYLQTRTQNDQDNKTNIFKHHQLASYWVLLHYNITKDLKVAVTPFCYFNTISLYPQPPELGNRGVKEFRWAVQLENTSQFKLFNYSNRYSVEYRYRDLQHENTFISNYRVRYRARLEAPIHNLMKPFSVILYDEVLLEFGNAVKNSAAKFNQNRLYLGTQCEVVKNIKFTLGYMYVIQERSSGHEVDNSNVLWGMLTFDNVFSQFKKEKEKDQ